MRKHAVAVLVVSSLVGIPGTMFAAETSAPLFKDSSVESLQISPDAESGGAVIRKVAVNYHVLYYTMPGGRDLIARETVRSNVVEASEGEQADATVDLFYRKKDQSYPQRPDHSTTVSEVSELKFNTDHWVGKTFGCCDAEPFLQLFGYGESKPFLYTNTKYAQINLPNANVNRYVGVVLRSQAPLDEWESAIFGSDKKALAAILYGAPGRPMQKLLLAPKKGVSEADAPYHTESLTLKAKNPKDEDGYNEDPNLSKVLTQWSRDVSPDNSGGDGVPGGFEIIAKFAGNDGKPETVTVPVEKDKLGKPRLSGQTLMHYEKEPKR